MVKFLLLIDCIFLNVSRSISIRSEPKLKIDLITLKLYSVRNLLQIFNPVQEFSLTNDTSKMAHLVQTKTGQSGFTLLRELLSFSK